MYGSRAGRARAVGTAIFTRREGGRQQTSGTRHVRPASDRAKGGG